MKFHFKHAVLVNYSMFLFLSVIVMACTKPVDFNQVDNIAIPADYVLTLVHFEKTAPDFLNVQNEEIYFTTDQLINPFKSLTQKYLDSVELTVETTNSFNRNFTCEIVFYNSNNFPIYTVQPTIEIKPGDTNKQTVLVIPNSSLSTVFSANYVGFNFTMSKSTDGSIFQSSDPGTFQFKSFVTLHYIYKKV